MIKCPNCGTSHSLENERCCACNFKLPDNFVPIETNIPETKSCWNCKCLNSITASNCTQCNIRFAENRQVQKMAKPKWNALGHTFQLAV